MPMTVGQYALDRGYSRKAIYKAIDRLGINETHTYKGINNGKETILISDDGIRLLDENLQPSQKSNDALKKTLELAIRDREAQLIQEKADKVEELTTKFTTLTEQLHKEKEHEIIVTRSEMLERVDKIGVNLMQTVDQIREDKDALISELRGQIAKLEADNERLTTQCQLLTKSLNYAKKHPIKFAMSQELPAGESCAPPSVFRSPSLPLRLLPISGARHCVRLPPEICEPTLKNHCYFSR